MEQSFPIYIAIVYNSVVTMPLVKPPRDLSKVRCVKKIRDKNGEIRHDLRVLFDYVRFKYVDHLDTR